MTPMSSPGMVEEIQAAARGYLESGAVSCVIGYERGPRGNVRPAFVYDADDVARLTWDLDCNLDLVTYLHNFKHSPGRDLPIPTVAVVVRPCDARAINLLIHEQQIQREHIKVIGLVCTGTHIRGESRFACSSCPERVPVIYDTLVGRAEGCVRRSRRAGELDAGGAADLLDEGVRPLHSLLCMSPSLPWLLLL
jgi:coenzyme F420-reducing hydrogenase beta subunit